jgi:hypothetical protein
MSEKRRARLLIEADLLDVHDTMLHCDLNDDSQAVDAANEQLNDLLVEWRASVPRQRPA